MKFFAKVFEEIRMMYTVLDRRADNHLSAKKFSGIVVIPKDYSKNVLSGKASRAVQSVDRAGAGRVESVFANRDGFHDGFFVFYIMPSVLFSGAI